MRIVHAVTLGEDFSRLIAGADRSNVSVRQSAVPMVQPVIVPSLSRRIRIVLGLGADAKVGGVDARRVVANVHNNFAVGDWPNVKFIRVAMCANRLFAGKKKDAVTGLISVSFPFPTAISFFKTIFKNVLRLYQRILVQTIRGSSAGVTSAAQFSCNRFFGPTLNAVKLGSGLISHRSPPVAHSI